MSENREQISEIKRKISSLNLNEKVFDGIDLTFGQQLYERGKPKKYFESTIELFKALGGKNIVEIGCMRAPLRHPIAELHSDCCNDGHSTYFWSLSGANVESVDICPNAVRIARESCKEFKNRKITRGDGIKFLEYFTSRIDLLFLDAWDVDDNTAYAENHLTAYLKAKPRLNKTNIIAIDDTDIGKGGKGRYLVPVLMDDGYQILVKGRQTIALKEDGR